MNAISMFIKGNPDIVILILALLLVPFVPFIIRLIYRIIKKIARSREMTKKAIKIIKDNSQLSYEEMELKAQEFGLPLNIVKRSFKRLKPKTKLDIAKRIVAVIFGLLLFLYVIIYILIPNSFWRNRYINTHCKNEEVLIYRCCQFKCVPPEQVDGPNCAVECRRNLFRLF